MQRLQPAPPTPLSSRTPRSRKKRNTVPSALRAAMLAQGAGSPTVGFTLPHGSCSTDGMASPFGTSPFGTGMHPFGGGNGMAPMSYMK